MRSATSNLPDRRLAQAHADRIAACQDELARLQSEGVLALDSSQQQAIASHHAKLLARYARDFDIDPTRRAQQLSLGMRVASFLGALALAASVFFLFYQFWGYFPEVAQASILVTAALATFYLANWLQQRDATGYFSKLAALVAFTCFVLNLSMLGSILNITPTEKALLPWAVLALVFAYSGEQRLLLVTGILCLIGFVAARVGTWSGIYWLHAGERPENFFPAAALLLALAKLDWQQRYPGFAASYRVFGLLTVFIPILVLSHWGDGSYLDLPPDLIEGGYQVLGFVGSALAVYFGVRRDWPDTVNIGTTFFVVFLYTKFFDWWWEAMPKYLFFLVLGLIALLILLVLKRVRQSTCRGAR
ncbi:DUF2157 domain-containing protein [Accumulibacter sp.]|uniref:DUF2157 domain-containing protein n=1 Tax=Accumulibacter sp. TaxID=2053492 RepID=UPI00262650B3|nr:DUF2157 domain-containing protein [Accumulibacter sp.]